MKMKITKTSNEDGEDQQQQRHAMVEAQNVWLFAAEGCSQGFDEGLRV